GGARAQESAAPAALLGAVAHAAAQSPARAARPPADAGTPAVQRSFWRQGPRTSAAAPAARTRWPAAGAGSGTAGPAQRADPSPGKRHRRRQREDENTRLLLSVPGLGPILAAVIAREIDDPRRFADAEHLCAYAGLVPTT